MKPTGIIRSFLLKAGMICFMLLLLLFPSSALTGAKSGLMLWFGQVLPSLLPFLIISGLFLSSGLSDVIAKRLAPFLSPVFGCSPTGCYAIVIGLLAGLPVGAKTTATLIESGRITKEEGQYLLPLCNNPSPLFILGYVSVSVLNAPYLRYPLLLIITLSSVLAAILLRPAGILKHLITQTRENSSVIKLSFSFSLLDAAIEQAFAVLLRVGGYIILFSVLGSFLTLLPLPPVFLSCLLSVLEITTGSSAVSTLPLPRTIIFSLICGFVTFGGLSTAAQTKSVLAGIRLPFAHYLLTKFVAGILATLSMLLFLYVTA